MCRLIRVLSSFFYALLSSPNSSGRNLGQTLSFVAMTAEASRVPTETIVTGSEADRPK
jgi:hypothetical protein